MDRHHHEFNRAAANRTTNHSGNLSDGIRALWQALTGIGSRVKGFMVYRSEPDWQVVSGTPLCEYEYKARFYAYLSPLEEQRDWLERLYRKSE